MINIEKWSDKGLRTILADNDLVCILWNDAGQLKNKLITVDNFNKMMNFLDLVDTPDTYVGQGGKVVAVKSDGTGLEYITLAASGVVDFLDLSDVPSVYTGAGGKAVAVKGDESGLEFLTFPSGGGGSADVVWLADQKTAGTGAGAFTTGAWRKRDLNTELSDTAGHASLASSQITLAAGDYQCEISCPAYGVGGHKARLYDTTGSAVLLTGTGEYAPTGGSSTRSEILGTFTLSVSSVLEVQHQCETTNGGSNGFGISPGFSTTETFTTVKLTKL